MFGLRRYGSRAPVSAARAPDGVLIYAVGDVHGRLDLLNALIARIEDDAALRPDARRILVFLGDYVDRGDDSRGVVERLARGIPGFETIFLKGNHEQVLLDFLSDPAPWEEWRRFGGLETLVSYGVDRALLFGPCISPEAIRDAFVNALPQHHREFFRALRPSFSCGDYYFVHAGIRPGVPFEEQVEADQLWIRDEFLTAGNVFDGRVIVHGHTPREAPERRDFRIGIDTGAYLTGRLTAVRLEGEEVRFLSG